MSERGVVIAGFVVLLVITLGALAVTHRRHCGSATLGQTVAYLTRTRTAAVVAILAWGWIGWHFLAR
ncbi:DUF6186 family protein [Nocardia sp. CDC159]|uniref:DUF6186 family protein n=1 Tax=Nocardia pulmonis TaxID=2951408 RepID=A0A9X2IVD3_9NOCA|nr:MULTISPECIES: DUF6186 family protein [Nocardia]MCM6772329.1 DUF6186 family protein [Nocardia pulmonis]MCM6785013.1 DUF6186 family protein [Nocardia sp. CDC159]